MVLVHRGDIDAVGPQCSGNRMAIDPDQFRAVLGRFASGVTVLTARDADGRDHGMAVSAFCSVSLVPPLVLACVDRTAEMFERAEDRARQNLRRELESLR